jgi:hypothetical protein
MPNPDDGSANGWVENTSSGHAAAIDTRTNISMGNSGWCVSAPNDAVSGKQPSESFNREPDAGDLHVRFPRNVTFVMAVKQDRPVRLPLHVRQQSTKFKKGPPSHVGRRRHRHPYTVSLLQHPQRHGSESGVFFSHGAAKCARLTIVLPPSLDLCIQAVPWMKRIRDSPNGTFMGVMLPPCTKRSARTRARESTTSC